MRKLTTTGVHSALKQFFPEKNDDYKCSYEEELKELRDFGITGKQQLLLLLQRRADAVMEIDRSPMNEVEIRMHADHCGEKFVANRLRKGFWFSYPALLRIALELEFGESYKQYAERRDRVIEPTGSVAKRRKTRR